MPAVIARIRLANGELGYIDDLSGVYLNWAQPEKDIYAGTNCTNLRRSVKAHRIILVAGSLGRPKTFNEILHKINPPEPEPIYEVDAKGQRTIKTKLDKPKKTTAKAVKEKPEPITEEPVVEEVRTEIDMDTNIAVEEPTIEVPVQEEVTEETTTIEEPQAEEVVQEDAPAKEEKPKKKKSKKKS